MGSSSDSGSTSSSSVEDDALIYPIYAWDTASALASTSAPASASASTSAPATSHSTPAPASASTPAPTSTSESAPASSSIAYSLRPRHVPKANVSQIPKKRSKDMPQTRTLSNKKKKADLNHPLKLISVRRPLCMKERISRDIEKYSKLANQALEYYNSMQKTNFKLVEVTAAAKYSLSPTLYHINFMAACGDSSKLFYAELKDVYPRHDDTEFNVIGCCMLERIDSGNPLGNYCSICRVGVIHPGPRDGYRVVDGDAFKGSEFWEYHWYASHAWDKSYAHCFPCNKTLTARYMHIYVASAKKALEYFNNKQRVNFRFLEVTIGCHKFYHYRRTAHLNFLAKSSSNAKPKLFYAEVYLPMFNGEVVDSWDQRKESFIEVKTCSCLKKVHSGNPFGRVCSLCFKDVLHPGPRDGYEVIAGDDDYHESDFMQIGTGVF